MTLTFGIYKSSFSWLHKLQLLQKSTVLPFSLINACDPIWPWLKTDQGQPRVIIWTDLVGPNAAYQVSRSLTFQSWDEDFQSVFTINGHGGHLSHVIQVSFPHPRGATCNLASFSPAVLEKKLKILNLKHPGQRSINDLDLWYLSKFI